jgi:uncharacterized protein YabN with tetrapyrrole methylase and pyrophosphatase domain
MASRAIWNGSRERVISRVLTLVETVDAADADYLLEKLGDVLVHAPLDNGANRVPMPAQ